MVVEQHAARVRRRQPDDHAERRRLAGAVRAEQADDFAGRHVEVDVADDDAAAVGLREILDAQDAHYGGQVAPWDGQFGRGFTGVVAGCAFLVYQRHVRLHVTFLVRPPDCSLNSMLSALTLSSSW